MCITSRPAYIAVQMGRNNISLCVYNILHKFHVHGAMYAELSCSAQYLAYM